MKILSVMFGGFIGAIARYSIGEWIHTNNDFPLGTLIINLLGCFLLGWFLTFITIKKKRRTEYTLFLGTGLIGSFTTFSTFSVETIRLLQNGLLLNGALYILTSILLGLLLTYIGVRLAIINGEKGVTN